MHAVIPVLVFLAANRMAGLRWAVLATTIGSLAIAVDRRRKGQPLGRLMPIVTAAVVVRGAIGIVTGSETVYFGLGIATKYLIAAALLGSATVGVPLAERAAPLVMRIPQEMAEHRLFRSTMAIITAIAGMYYIVSASFDIWLFRRSSVEGFVMLRFFANWPLSAVTLLAILVVLQWRLQKIPGVPPVATLVEERRAAAVNSSQTPIDEPSRPQTDD
jgi:intracellular septation protein A